MSTTQDMPSNRLKPWQGKAWVNLLAIVIGVIPLYSTAVILQVRGGLAVSLEGYIFYLAVICPLSIAVALLLMRYLCGESPRGLNLRPGRVSRDLLATLVLSVVIIAANVISTGLLSELLPTSRSGDSVRNLFLELAGNPRLLALFLGLLIFLGAASEEVVRAFFLSRLLKVWPSAPGKVAAVLISAGLFGLVHLYQGPVHVASAGILGLILAVYYVRFGRILPLILAHYVTNVIQVIVFVANVQ